LIDLKDFGWKDVQMWLFDLSHDLDSHFLEELSHALGQDESFSLALEILMHFVSYHNFPNSTSFSMCLILSLLISSSFA